MHGLDANFFIETAKDPEQVRARAARSITRCINADNDLAFKFHEEEGKLDKLNIEPQLILAPHTRKLNHFAYL